MKKLALVVLFIASPVFADNTDLIKAYCRAYPEGCAVVMQQLISQKFGLPYQQAQPAPQPIYVPEPVYYQPPQKMYSPPQPTYLHTHCNPDGGGGMSCSTY